MFFLCRNVKNWKIGILFNFQQHVNKVLNIGEFHLSVPRIKYDNNGKTYFIHRNWKYPGSINLLREGKKIKFSKKKDLKIVNSDNRKNI